MFAQNCSSFLLLRQQKSTKLNPVLDTMRHKLRGIRAKCVYRLQLSRNGCPTGAPAAESCQNRQQKCFWRNQPKMFQVSRRKKQKLLALSSPVCTRFWGRRRIIAQERWKRQHGAIRQSNISSVYQENAYSVLLMRIKHASVTDARSSWLERCRALMYSAFIHVAACHATCWTVFPGLSAAACPEQPLCGWMPDHL